MDLLFIVDHEYTAQSEGELSLSVGEVIDISSEEQGWFYGKNRKSGKEGWVARSCGHTRQKSPYHNLSDPVKREQRKLHFKALLNKQSGFVNELKRFIDSVVVPVALRDTQFKRTFLSDPAVAVSFSLLQEIFNSCSNFEKVLREATTDVSIANAYIQFAPSMQLFGQYASENAKLLNTCERSGDPLAALIPKDLHLEQFLVRPVQHYTTFRDDFQEYIWLTAGDESLVGALDVALELVAAQTDSVALKLKEEEEGWKILHLQSKCKNIFVLNRFYSDIDNLLKFLSSYQLKEIRSYLHPQES